MGFARAIRTRLRHSARLTEDCTMWRDDRDRPDDPPGRDLETERLARDEYDRPRYGTPPRARPVNAAGVRPAHAEDAPRRDAGHRTYQPPTRTIEEVRVHELMTRRVTSVHPATAVERAAR